MDQPADYKDRLKASYDAIAVEYNAWTEERHHHIRLKYLDELLDRVPKLGAASSRDASNAAVLELGAGAGKPFLYELLARTAPQVTATANDLSDTQIGLARVNLEGFAGRVMCQAGDMMALDFSPGSLTAVVALYSLIHLAREEQAAMLVKISGWLEPGGVLVATFNLGDEAVVYEHWLHEKGWMYWSGLGVEGTKKKLAEVGLKVEKAEIEGDEEEKFLWIIARK